MTGLLPGLGGNLIGAAGATAPASFPTITQSLRFDSASNSSLTRTLPAGNRRVMTFSCWVKRGIVLNNQDIFSAGVSPTSSNYHGFGFENTTDILRVLFVTGGSTVGQYVTVPAYRDPTAWYHIVIAIDTTQATAANRVRIYVNGAEPSKTVSNTLAQNTDLFLGSNTQHLIGERANFGNNCDMLMADIAYVNGLQLTPSSFAQSDPATGQWVPKNYTGAFGANGFNLRFATAGATSSTIGLDTSGNGLNFNPGNFVYSPGNPGSDVLTDIPYNNSITSCNYATLNPLDTLTSATLFDGNLRFTTAASGTNANSTIWMRTGKWYWEVQTSAGTTQTRVGVRNAAVFPSLLFSLPANATWYGIRFDADAGTTEYTTNGSTWTSFGTGQTPSSGPYCAFFNSNGTTSKTISANFGQQPFAFTIPTGYKALNSYNDPTLINTSSQYYKTTLYTGNGAARSITGVGHAPSLTIIKNRGGTTGFPVYDKVRGATIQLLTNATTAEATQAQGLTAFGSDGFSLGTLADVNVNAGNFASWNWPESATGGMDIVTYTGSGANRTIAHSLGAIPKFMIFKARGSAIAWPVYHSALGAGSYITLDNSGILANTTVWNNTAPTSSVFSLGTNTLANSNTVNYVAYLFAEVPGFSAFGSYTGNSNASGPYIPTGFRPALVIIKNYTASNTDAWRIMDSSRSPANPAIISASFEAAVADISSTAISVDFLAAGFKIRNSSTGYNASTNTYLYAAFAESPFKNALAR